MFHLGYIAEIVTLIFEFDTIVFYRLGSWAQFFMLLAVSPLGLIFMAAAVQHVIYKPDALSAPLELVSGAWVGTQAAMLWAVVDGHLIGSITYTLFSLALVPVWCMFWSMQYAEITVEEEKPDEVPEEKEKTS